MLFNLNGKDGILGTTGLGGLIRSIGNHKQNAANKLYVEQLMDTILSTGDLIAPDLRGKIDREGTKEEWGISDEILDSVIEIGEKYHTASEQAEALQGKMKGLSSIGSKLTGVFKAVGTTLLNGLASAALSWGITKLGEGLKWVYDNWLTNNAEIERQKKALEEVTQATEKYTRTIESIDEETAKYEELSEKLKDSTLTTSELVQVKSDLKAIQDQLIEQYGSEASGLDLVNGKYDEQIEKIKELKKEEAKKYLYGDEGVLNGDNLDNALKAINGKPNKSSIDLFRGVNAVGTPSENINNRYGGVDIQSVVDKYSAFSIGRRTTGKDDQTLILSFDINEGVSKEEAQKQLTDFFAELNSLYPNNKEVQKFISKVSEIDIGYNEEEAKKTRDSIKKIIESWLLYNDEDDISANAKQAVDDYNKALETYLSDDSADNEKALNDAFKKIGESRAAISAFMANSDIPDELRSYFAEFLNSIFDDKLSSPSERLNKYFEDATGTVKAAYGDLTRGLSEAEKNAFINLLPEDVQVLTIEEIIKLIKEAQEVAENNPVELKVKASAAVDSMADMKSAVASLSDLYNQTVLQAASENADSFGTFAADPATLNSIESAFDKFIQEKSSSGEDVSELNAALNEFQRTAVEEYGSPDYAEKMQVAIDNLITSYIDQTNIIKNLSEENAEWSKEQLKAMGIENADAVVKAKLSKKTKELMGNVTKLANSYNELTEAEEGTDAYNEALDSMAGDVAEMAGLDRNNQDFIDTDFVVKNLDLIRDAAAGSADAINQLRKEAAKEIAAKVHIEGNTQEILGYRDEINNLINNFDIDDIEVGARLDDNAMIKGLNNLVDAGIITRDSMNNILSGIGVEPYRTPGIDIPIEVYDQLKGLSGQALTEASRALAVRSSIKVPGISYRVTSKATGARYSAPSGGGSSSGGGGGGGGSSEPTKPKEESEETFDWIEVAIQRIEEEISRLDKVVGNSYTLWGNRNKALRDEIEKTTEEIKAQQLAQSEYLRNANLVQVNNGKGLNDDDYGENDSLVKANDQRLLDEARAAWATGEYQRKVREGQMSGDDIEKIQNHFLTEAIQSYQELFNKSVQAGDAVQDLQIKLGDLAQTKFDHVKDEFDELIQYITDASDVINERINYTEKHGYFVSKSYYEDLKKLESQHNAYLVDEYEELIRKRDEAVASGAISEGSSAWNKMNQEINAVNLSIDQSRTQMLEYNNTIRQLDWDFFDYIEERISRINDEASFLVDLMGNDKLYEDNGYLNALGHATNAMYAVQFETYMRQAQDYAKERQKLEKEIAKDPANKDLIARYEELVDAQQEAINGAEQMKDSVKSLVQEGKLMPYYPVMGII